MQIASIAVTAQEYYKAYYNTQALTLLNNHRLISLIHTIDTYDAGTHSIIAVVDLQFQMHSLKVKFTVF